MDDVERRPCSPQATRQGGGELEMIAPSDVAIATDLNTLFDRDRPPARVVMPNLGEYTDVTAEFRQPPGELSDMGLQASDPRRKAGGDQCDPIAVLAHASPLCGGMT